MFRFVIGSGRNRAVIERAPRHTAAWDSQKKDFRREVGLPALGRG